MSLNPYQSPREFPPMAGESPVQWSLLWLAPIGVLTAAMVGGATNTVNGLVSPEYFAYVMAWPNDGRIWARSIIQGMLEGAAFGVAFSSIFLSVVCFATRMRCPLRRAVRYISLFCGAGPSLWILGGLSAVLWSTFNPGMYRSIFYLPSAGAVRFAWVGGSIWAIENGGAGVLVIVSVLFIVNWRRRPS